MANPLLDLLGTVGTVLDTPGSVVRGLLAGDPSRAIRGIINPEDRYYGRDLLEQWGALDPNEEGLDAGDLAGFGVDLAVDPLAFLGTVAGGVKGAKGLRRLAMGPESPLVEGLGAVTKTPHPTPWKPGIKTVPLDPLNPGPPLTPRMSDAAFDQHLTELLGGKMSDADLLAGIDDFGPMPKGTTDQDLLNAMEGIEEAMPPDVPTGIPGTVDAAYFKSVGGVDPLKDLKAQFPDSANNPFGKRPIESLEEEFKWNPMTSQDNPFAKPYDPYDFIRHDPENPSLNPTMRSPYTGRIEDQAVTPASLSAINPEQEAFYKNMLGGFHADEEGAMPLGFLMGGAEPTKPLPKALAPTFYSRLENAAKALPDKPIKTDSLLNMLKKAPEGISMEEVQWRNLEDFIKGQGPTTTKSALLEHLEKNPIEVKTIKYTEGGKPAMEWEEVWNYGRRDDQSLHPQVGMGHPDEPADFAPGVDNVSPFGPAEWKTKDGNWTIKYMGEPEPTGEWRTLDPQTGEILGDGLSREKSIANAKKKIDRDGTRIGYEENLDEYLAYNTKEVMSSEYALFEKFGNTMMRVSSGENPHHLMEEARRMTPEPDIQNVRWGQDNYRSMGGVPGTYEETLLTMPSSKAKSIALLDEESRLIDQAVQDRFMGEWDRSSQARAFLENDPGAMAARYRAVLEERMNLPRDYQSSHWDEPNVLAHRRGQERNVGGVRTLHTDELQSDLHQAGKERGYDTAASRQAIEESRRNLEELGLELSRHTDLREYYGVYSPEDLFHLRNKGVLPESLQGFADDFARRWNEAQQHHIEVGGYGGAQKVPDFPFKDTWHELAMKQMLREAVEKGYGKISWNAAETIKPLVGGDWAGQIQHYGTHLDPEAAGLNVLGDLEGALRTNQQWTQGMGQPGELSVAKRGLLGHARPEVRQIPLPEGVYGPNEMAPPLSPEQYGEKLLRQKSMEDFLNKYSKKYGGKVEPETFPIEKQLEPDYSLRGVSANARQEAMNAGMASGEIEAWAKSKQPDWVKEEPVISSFVKSSWLDGKWNEAISSLQAAKEAGATEHQLAELIRPYGKYGNDFMMALGHKISQPTSRLMDQPGFGFIIPEKMKEDILYKGQPLMNIAGPIGAGALLAAIMQGGQNG